MTSLRAVTIRLAQLNDIDAILAVQEMSLRQISPGYYSPDQIDALVQDQSKYRYQDFLQVVAESEEGIVGFGSLSTWPFPQISGIYVHPDLTRQGIGTQLIQELEHLAVTQTKPWRVLRVLSSLMAAEFYQSQGYHLQKSSGFWTSDRVWIECKVLTKRLVPLRWWERGQPWLGLLILWLIAIVLTLLG